MSDYLNNLPATGNAELSARKRIKDPTNEDVAGRNSFPGVNENKHLDRMFGKSGGK